jgi:hypothetical protein
MAVNQTAPTTCVRVMLRRLLLLVVGVAFVLLGITTPIPVLAGIGIAYLLGGWFYRRRASRDRRCSERLADSSRVRLPPFSSRALTSCRCARDHQRPMSSSIPLPRRPASPGRGCVLSHSRASFRRTRECVHRDHSACARIAEVRIEGPPVRRGDVVSGVD